MEIRKIEDITTFELGKINNLKVVRFMPQGAYLSLGNDTKEVLLPTRYLSEDIEEGDFIDVFVYKDNGGRLIATSLEPLAQVGETKNLECIERNDVGAFLSWGIHKDLLVPYAEQKNKMYVGHSYIVHVYVDNISGKIVASSKLNKHIGNIMPNINPGEMVISIVVDRNDVGYRVVVNNIHWGIIYYSDIDNKLEIGKEYSAYVVRVREDGKIDLSIKPIGYAKVESIEKNLLDLLETNNGFISLGDKSDADDIKSIIGISKKAFKMAIGGLYKKGMISISDYNIKLKNNNLNKYI